MGSNYEKQVFGARDIFLRYDQQALIDKYDLEHDRGYLYLSMLREKYRIDRKTGEIQVCVGEGDRGREQYEPCLEYRVVMSIYDVLCYPKERPSLAGEWCPLASLQVTNSSPSDQNTTKYSARKFSGRVEELKDALGKLGGQRQAVPASADACYVIPVFSFFPILFQFWDGDEEFAPSITLLWDKNALRFMHFETLYYVMGHLLGRVEELMGV